MTDPFEGLEVPPTAKLLGARDPHFDREAGTLRMGFVARPDFANPMGVVQGGFLTAMLDDAMGPLIFAIAGRFGSTIDLNVQFLRPVAPGPVEVLARMVRQGRSVAFLEAELEAAGKPSVRATASFFLG